MSKIHLDKIQNLAGFAAKNVKKGKTAKLIVRASLISDEQEFYTYTDQISNLFLNKCKISIDTVFRFLVVIHRDLSADLYINNFPVAIEITAKSDIRKGQVVRKEDIADIRRLKFPDIKIVPTDKIIYCFKIGWKFALFFDLDPQHNLDIDKMSLSLGELYRYLYFQHVYNVLESQVQFEEMMKDGWFPFIEIIANEYKSLTEAYQNKFGFQNKIHEVVNNFNKVRIEKIAKKWWSNQIFKDKQPILEAGINAYIRGADDDFINCIKTLLPEIEGIIRFLYLDETGRGKKVRLQTLLQYIAKKGKIKSGSDYSLFLSLPFLSYLQNVVFANFNLEAGQVVLSRHSSSHGVANASDYTKIRALQTILILDQIYFYI